MEATLFVSIQSSGLDDSLTEDSNQVRPQQLKKPKSTTPSGSDDLILLARNEVDYFKGDIRTEP